MSISLSRYALDQFIKCPLCFYTQRKLGLKPPAMIPLTLALATDALLKNEFDAVRASGASHPLWKQYGINVAAFQHTELDLWRNNKKGIRVRHESTGAEIFGSVDDVWLNLDTLARHHRHAFINLLRRPNAHHFVGHDFADREVMRRLAEKDDLARVIAFRQDAAQLVVAHHQQCADVFFGHQLQRVVHAAVRSH